MWICSRCHTENHENQSVCESCGAARSAGRFSAPAMQGPARAPRVSPAASQPAPEMRRAAPAYQPPATDMSPTRPPRRPLQFFARLVGILLCLLLPLANLLLLLSLSDLLSSDSDSVDRELEEMEDRRTVAAALATLPARDREIISLRYGLGGKRPMTQKEVADRMGISQSYISRIEKKNMERLKKEIGAKV